MYKMTRRHCPTCGGKGWIPNPKVGGVQAYYNPHTGSSWPEMTCPNCGGSGFVGTPDNS